MVKKAIIIISIVLITITCIYAQTPTRWRGASGNGVYSETGLLKKWPANGPEILWHFDKLGLGHSSPAFANGLIYVSGMEGTTGNIYALTPDGKLKWKKSYGAEFSESYPGRSFNTGYCRRFTLYLFRPWRSHLYGCKQWQCKMEKRCFQGIRWKKYSLGCN
jgi:hypothetical protein